MSPHYFSHSMLHPPRVNFKIGDSSSFNPKGKWQVVSGAPRIAKMQKKHLFLTERNRFD
jgi:hypothetical protein